MKLFMQNKSSGLTTGLKLNRCYWLRPKPESPSLPDPVITADLFKSPAGVFYIAMEDKQDDRCGIVIHGDGGTRVEMRKGEPKESYVSHDSGSSLGSDPGTHTSLWVLKPGEIINVRHFPGDMVIIVCSEDGLAQYREQEYREMQALAQNELEKI